MSRATEARILLREVRKLLESARAQGATWGDNRWDPSQIPSARISELAVVAEDVAHLIDWGAP